MPFAALRNMSNLLPRDGKLVLPRPMPLRLRLPPRIAVFGFPVRPMPHALLAAFGDHGMTAIGAFANKVRLRFPTNTLDVSILHRPVPPSSRTTAFTCLN